MGGKAAQKHISHQSIFAPPTISLVTMFLFPLFMIGDRMCDFSPSMLVAEPHFALQLSSPRLRKLPPCPPLSPQPLLMAASNDNPLARQQGRVLAMITKYFLFGLIPFCRFPFSFFLPPFLLFSQHKLPPMTSFKHPTREGVCISFKISTSDQI